jgi:DNA-binding transcriptional MerR regulator
MIRIGVFSKISQVPVSTLRYYDEIGLLKAIYTDKATGYRYYSFNQLPRLWRIMALKDMGLSLDEIRQLLENNLTYPELRGMLRLKQAERHRQILADRERLIRFENWLKVIEQEKIMPDYEVVLKKIEPMNAFSIREVIPDYPDQGALWDELDDFLSVHQIQVIPPGVTIYHGEEPEIDLEVCLQVRDGEKAAEVPLEHPVRLGEIPGVTQAASTIHSGPLRNIGEGYRALISWIEEQGFSICGPVREVYHQGPTAHSQTDPDVIVELQAPVAKEGSGTD